MFTHSFDPVFVDLALIEIRWYSLSYIFGILVGWWYGRKIISKINQRHNLNLKLAFFDDYITYIILGIIIGGRLGYVAFYNLSYFLYYHMLIIKD